mgnify:CR=1 FL=1
MPWEHTSSCNVHGCTDAKYSIDACANLKSAPGTGFGFRVSELPQGVGFGFRTSRKGWVLGFGFWGPPEAKFWSLN